MLSPIRLATPEEVDAIAKDSDLIPGCSVVALDQMRGVLRLCTELDPVFYGDASGQRRALFIWGVENMLRFSGLPCYYFNVPADDEKYIETVKGWGAEQVSKVPELRFKRTL